MTTPKTLIHQRQPPKRPPTPNEKGLGGGVTMPLKLLKPTLARLKKRAAFETMRWRLAHEGKGRAISVQDILRRLIQREIRRGWEGE